MGEVVTGRERRRTLRVELHLPLQVRIGSVRPGRDLRVAGELLDAGLDGCGAALLLPVESRVPLGAAIALLMDGIPDIGGIVVSRLGVQARYRVGVRVDSASREDLLALLASTGH